MTSSTSCDPLTQWYENSRGAGFKSPLGPNIPRLFVLNYIPACICPCSNFLIYKTCTTLELTIWVSTQETTTCTRTTFWLIWWRTSVAVIITWAEYPATNAPRVGTNWWTTIYWWNYCWIKRLNKVERLLSLVIVLCILFSQASASDSIFSRNKKNP